MKRLKHTTDITNKELLDKINRVSKENGHGDMSSVILTTFMVLIIEEPELPFLLTQINTG